MSDQILRLTVAQGTAVAYIAQARETVEKARALHATSPVVSAALGRLLIASSMMGQMLDDEKDKISVIIKGEGPVGTILATSNRRGQVKGFALRPQIEVPNKPNGKLDVGGLIGPGSLTVLKDVGGDVPFSGTVELFSSEIAEDLAYYYAQSEQTPTAMALGVHVSADYTIGAAGGFMIQILPDADEAVIEQLEKNIRELGAVSDFYLQGGSPEELAERLFGNLGYEIHERCPLEFHCSCSKEKLTSVLISLGRQELESMLHEDKGADVRCEFCNSSYHFSEEDLKTILAKM
ncbi:MAG: Hsp33 family molecular chaperone HslO [Eubacteriales bacterium]|nr:Hsp33 family molecular chaperone HslO [Eubacteriales bacterium]